MSESPKGFAVAQLLKGIPADWHDAEVAVSTGRDLEAMLRLELVEQSNGRRVIVLSSRPLHVMWTKFPDEMR